MKFFISAKRCKRGRSTNVNLTLFLNSWSTTDIPTRISNVRMKRKALHQWYTQENRSDDGGNKIKLFYRNFMHSNYQQDEAAIHSIISNNAFATDPDSAIHLINYYKNKRTSQLIMKNSPQMDNDPLKKHGVVYRIIYPENGYNHSYIGMTTTRLSKRLSVHLQEGNFFQHFRQHHGVLQQTALLENTTIIDKDQDRRRLRLREALHIMKLKPTLNITQERLLLPTNVCRTHPPS